MFPFNTLLRLFYIRYSELFAMPTSTISIGSTVLINKVMTKSFCQKNYLVAFGFVDSDLFNVELS